MARVARGEKSGGIVTTSLDVATHERFVGMAEARGMTLKSFMSRWIRWMAALDPSEAAIVLDQIAREDVPTVAEAVIRRRKKAQREMDQLVEAAHRTPPPQSVPHAAASAAGERVGGRPKTPAAG